MGGDAVMKDRSRCPACGQPNREAARFCTECGSLLEATSERLSAAPGTTTPADAVSPAIPAKEPPGPPAANSLMAADGASQQARPGSRPRRGRVAVPLAGVLVAGVLALAGWQTGWPPVIFGAKQVSSTARLASPSAARPGYSSAPQASASITSASPPTASPGSPAASKGPAKPRLGGPAATVQAFFAAIDSHHYATAWKLGGKYTAPSYAAFANGLNTTVRDTVTVLSVSGNVVTARLTAVQTDGTVKTFRGTYTIDNGVIIKFHVRQIN
jgi:zinc-ribbon domain